MSDEVSQGNRPQFLKLSEVADLLRLIDRLVDERVRRLEEAVQHLVSRKVEKKGEAEEYLDIQLLSERINTPVKTIRDWVYKRRANKIPVIKLPTGGLLFPWGEFEAWMRGGGCDTVGGAGAAISERRKPRC